MILEDRIYGKEEVKEKILIDLINSPELERLKGVSQLGLPEKYSSKKGFSRYEHSLGVFLLVRKLGATIDEQIAGLLHDINHLSFSHVIDWVLGDPTKEDHQDKNYASFLKNSLIPKILSKYNFDFSYFLNLDKFSLVEKEAPSLCADRIDYSLREMNVDGNCEISQRIFENLAVKENQIVFKNWEYASLFAKEYSSLQNNSWGSEDSRARHFILSEVLKKSFKEKILKLEDLKNSEEEILNHLENSSDSFIKNYLNLLRDGFELLDDSNGFELKKKFRYIDPEILFNGFYKSLSNFSNEYSNFLNQEKRKYFLENQRRVIPKRK
jgi:uncharacterized protein